MGYNIGGRRSKRLPHGKAGSPTRSREGNRPTYRRSGIRVAGTTATRTACKSTTRADKPHVRILDAERGLYTVQSERYT